MVKDGSAHFFGTRELGKVRGTVHGHPLESTSMAFGNGTHRISIETTLRSTIRRLLAPGNSAFLGSIRPLTGLGTRSWCSTVLKPSLWTAMAARWT